MVQDSVEEKFREAVKAHQGGHMDAAGQLYKDILLQSPDHAKSWVNLGAILRIQKKPNSALVCYRRALNLEPDNVHALSNMGNLLRDIGWLDEALSVFQKLRTMNLKEPEIDFNAALVSRELGFPEEHLRLLDELLETHEDKYKVLWEKSLCLLALGRYREGFRLYETRWKRKEARRHRFPGEPWRGQPLDGRIIFISAEQGFGDQIQFARFLPEVARRGGRIWLEAKPNLGRLLAHLDCVERVVPYDQKPEGYDFHLPLMSLPWVLQVSLSTLPSACPYLSLPAGEPPALPGHGEGKLKIGLNWSGKPTPFDRSCPLELLLPIAQHPDVSLYSVQFGEASKDIQKLGAEALITDLSIHHADFLDTALLLKQMDMVITIDSSPAHLAAALGLPTWLLLPRKVDWRWMIDRNDSPWYPSMRIFRQQRNADWGPPIRDMLYALDTLVRTRKK